MNAVELLRDALARLTRAYEALSDGDFELLELLLADLRADLWRSIEILERAA